MLYEDFSSQFIFGQTGELQVSFVSQCIYATVYVEQVQFRR